MKKTYTKPLVVVTEAVLQRYCTGPQVGSGGTETEFTRKKSLNGKDGEEQGSFFGSKLWED